MVGRWNSYLTPDLPQALPSTPLNRANRLTGTDAGRARPQRWVGRMADILGEIIAGPDPLAFLAPHRGLRVRPLAAGRQALGGEDGWGSSGPPLG